jgi:hypothetical protein
MKRLALLSFALVLAACGIRAPLRYQVRIDFDRDPSRARVTSVTEMEKTFGDDAVRRRLQPVRDAILNERDEWSVRFQQVNPESERFIIDREYGEIVRSTRTGMIERDQLARFFGDLPMTVTVSKGDGWTEMAIYPGSSSRATRQQREAVEGVLHLWSHDVANYFNRMSNLYRWIDAHPQMAEHAFRLLFEDENNAHATDEEEDALITGARNAMTAVTERLQRKEGETVPVDELFDLVYNPFPAEITVHTPRAIVGVEHFEHARGEDTVVIPHAGLIDAARSLEGRWVSPDPLALILRSEETKLELPTAAELASMKRKWSAPLSASDLETALIDAVKPAQTYRVRWVE